MSQFRVEKQRAEAELTLASGECRRGCFFLAASTPTHLRPERVKDLLNLETGFCPFEIPDSRTVLVHRSHLVTVRLMGTAYEPHLDAGYDVALAREVELRLSNRVVLRGTVRIFRPEGHDRLSDYARSPELFRYLENPEGAYIVNTAHIVEFSEVPS
jgi:hypothetical protein